MIIIVVNDLLWSEELARCLRIHSLQINIEELFFVDVILVTLEFSVSRTILPA